MYKWSPLLLVIMQLLLGMPFRFLLTFFRVVFECGLNRYVESFNIIDNNDGVSRTPYALDCASTSEAVVQLCIDEMLDGIWKEERNEMPE